MSASLSEQSERCTQSELTCSSSTSDDEVGGDQARSALSERSERSNQSTYQE